MTENKSDRIVDFKEECQEKYIQFSNEVIEYAYSQCQAQFPGIGLAFLVLNDVDFPTEFPGKVKPQIEEPLPLAQNPSAAVVAEYTRRLNDFQKVVDASVDLKALIITKIGKDNITLCLKDDEKIRTKSIEDIMTSMKKHHSNPEAAVIDGWQSSLVAPIGDAKLVTHCANHRKTHMQLSRAGDGFKVSNNQKLKSLIESLSLNSAYVTAIQSYKNLYPAPKDQNFEDLAKYIMDRVGKSSAKESGFKDSFAGAGSACVTRDTVEKMIKDATKEAYNEGFKAAMASQAVSVSKSVKEPVFYCWKHGTGKHHGNMCDEMTKNNKTKYTNQQRGARKPSDCPDGAAPA